MSVALVMFTDGRDHVFDEDRRSSWEERLHGDVDAKWIFDDSANEKFREQLLAAFPDWRITSWPKRRGFGGTIRRAWAMLNIMEPSEYVFHLEDDFTLAVDVELEQMRGILDRHPHLAQVALRRQPVNDLEIAAGGVVELDPGAYDQSGDGYAQWLEHRLYFTTNPCLYRRSLCAVGWPGGAFSEGHFTHDKLLAHGTPEAAAEHVRFALLGKRFDQVQVHHIGTLRAGEGY